jgi:hypothetical protein
MLVFFNCEETELVRSNVKIYGPPLMKAIKALEATAVEMSKTTALKFSHTRIPYPTRMQGNTKDWNEYLKNMERTYVDCYEPVKLISDFKQLLGEYDFFFEWTEEPTMARIEELLEKIDAALEGLGCYYKLTTE